MRCVSPAMEAIINKLLLPDNAAIAEGTQQLREAFKQPQAVPELCAVLAGGQTAQVRQYAAVLLRKKLVRASAWGRLSPESRAALKEGCLNALVAEADKSVKMALAQLVSSLARHEIKPGSSSWPELSAFLQQHLFGADPATRVLGMYLLSVLCDGLGEQSKLLLRHFSKAFQLGLHSDQEDVAFYAVKALTSLVRHVGSDDLSLFQPLLGPIIELVGKLVGSNEERAAEAMEVFDELFESEVAIVVPHIRPIVDLSLKIAANDSLQDELRVKAISLLGRLTKLKKKTILKHKLYIQMINVLFPIMSKISDEDLDDEPEVESSDPSMCACQTMDILAINMPPEKFMSALLTHVQPALKGTDPEKKKGAFNALAVSAEGCSEHIRTKYLVTLLQVIGNGIRDENPVVRNAALYALGQFSEFLQPDISNYATDILPMLFEYLDMYISAVETSTEAGKDSKGVDRICYALEIFSENLEEKLVPFLPELMKRLLHMLGDRYTVHTKELAISGIGAAASAAKEDIIPYFDEVMTHLKKYLSLEMSQTEDQVLLIQSMDTLGILARSVGPASFAPALAEECCKLGLDLIAKHDDPDVRKCAYALFGSVAYVVKQEMGPVLPKITELLLRSCSSKEGISFEYKDDETDLPLEELDDEEDDISLNTEDSMSEAGKIKTVNVENSYMEEKEQAVLSLKEICKNTGDVFFPFIYQSLEETWKLLDFPDEDMRKAAVEATSELCIAYHKQGTLSSSEAFAKAISNLLPKICSMVREDEEASVVCTCLDELVNLLKECKQAVTNIAGHPEQIIQCVHLVMKSECKCMDSDDFGGDGTGGDLDEHEAEQDELLFECAGEVIPALGRAMPPSAFAPYFAGLLPHLLKKTKRQCTEAERSFSAGTLAECMEPLGGVLDPFIPTLMKTFTHMISDPEEDVRNNAVFGLGELALHGGSSVFEHFPVILQQLSGVMSSGEESGRVLDQVVGALCRLVIANKNLVPVKDVLPVVFRGLPLRADKEEYLIVFQCLGDLHATGELLVRENLSQVLLLTGTLWAETKKPCDNWDSTRY